MNSKQVPVQQPGDEPGDTPGIVSELSPDTEHSGEPALVVVGQGASQQLDQDPLNAISGSGAAAPFPTSALGPVAGPGADAIAQIVQVPAAIAGTSVLAVCALLAQAHIDVDFGYGRKKPTSLYLLSLGISGERKTSADDHAKAALIALEERLRDEHEDAKEDYNRALAKGEYATEPMWADVVFKTGTVEGVFSLLANGRGSAAVFNDDAAGFLGGYSMSKDSRPKSAAVLSQVWDGASATHITAGSGSTHLSGKRLSIHLSLQPELMDMLLNEQLRAQGLLSRFLVTYPDSLVGTRFSRRPNPAWLFDHAVYVDHMAKIASLDLVYRSARRRSLATRPLPICPRGSRALDLFSDSIEAQLGAGGLYEAIVGHGAKLAENAGRIAGALAFCHDPDIGEIPLEYIERGIELAKHYGFEMLRLHGLKTTSQSKSLVQRTRDWLENSWQKPKITRTELMQKSPARNAHDVRQVATELERQHVLKPIAQGPKGEPSQWEVIRNA